MTHPLAALLALLLLAQPAQAHQSRKVERVKPAAQHEGDSCIRAGDNRAIGRCITLRSGFSEAEFACLDWIMVRENNWRTDRGGIPQAKPMKKMAAAGPAWRTDAATQIRWAVNIYIPGRYKTPCNAKAAWRRKGWY